MKDATEFVPMEVKEEPMDQQGSSSHFPSSSAGVDGVRHPERAGYLIIDSSDDLKKEVKEEPFEDHSYATLPTSSSSQQTSGAGDLRSPSRDFKEEDVWVKDEPIEEVDPLAINTTTFTPKPESTWTKDSGAQHTPHTAEGRTARLHVAAATLPQEPAADQDDSGSDTDEATQLEADLEFLKAVEHYSLRRERVFRDRLNPLDISDDLLLTHYRLPRHEILQLCEEIGPHIHRPTNRAWAIPVHTQVLVALRFYASGKFQNVVGDAAGISQSSISRVIKGVTEALFDKAIRDIKMPQDQQALMQTKQGFYALHGFPSVIGAIDCTHIPIKGPTNPIPFMNRQSRFTLNIQVVADSKMKIISFCARFPGSVKDSYIWGQSILRQQFVGGQFGESLLLGDAGYPLEPFLMTPVSQPMDDVEQVYNRSHARTHVVVEEAVGTLKSRFRCLHGSCGNLLYDPEKCARIAIVCMLLHNICIQKKIPLDEPLLEDEDPATEAYRGADETGQVRRKELIDNVFSCTM